MTLHINMKIWIAGLTLFAAVLTFRCSEPARSPGVVRSWTHFRGSNLDAVSEEAHYPVRWDDSTNIAWKTAIPGKGWSSPVILGDQVWCTTATTDGKEMAAVCTDFNTGENLYTLKVFEPDSTYRINAINTYATPTPCIENGFLYVHFGRYGTACIATDDGRFIWKRTDLKCEHVQGPGSSPILYKNMLILHLEGMDVRYIFALDKRNGETIWQAERPAELYEPLCGPCRSAYITPVVIRVNGRDLLISNGAAACMAYDVETGKEVWRIVQGENATIAMPVVSGDLIYFYAGFVTDSEGDKYCELMAVDPAGQGDITGTGIRWRIKSPPLQLPSPVVKNGLLYTIDSGSNLICLDALSGDTVWSEKLQGKYNSSLVWAAGNIYFNSTRGETFVIRAGRTLDLIAVNSLEGEIWATPAFVDDAVIMRTSKYLYKIN
jgi:outer membrane protein assembly factor BamB